MQTEPLPSAKAISVQTDADHLRTTACQTIQQQLTVSNGTQTSSPLFVHVGTCPSPDDSNQAFKHVGLQVNLSKMCGNLDNLVSFGTPIRRFSKGERNIHPLNPEDSNSDKLNNWQMGCNFPKDTDFFSKGTAKDLAVSGKDQLARIAQQNCITDSSSSAFEKYEPFSSCHKSLQEQFSKLGKSSCTASDMPASTSIPVSSIWQHISSPQAKPSMTSCSQTGKVLRDVPDYQCPAGAGMESHVKEEHTEVGEKAFHDSLKVISSTDRIPSGKRVPKYPHLLYAEPEKGEESFNQYYPLNLENTSKPNQFCLTNQDIGKETQKATKLSSETVKHGVDLHEDGLTLIQKSHWDVHRKQCQDVCTSKQKDKESSSDLSIFSSKAGARKNKYSTENQDQPSKFSQHAMGIEHYNSAAQTQMHASRTTSDIDLCDVIKTEIGDQKDSNKVLSKDCSKKKFHEIDTNHSNQCINESYGNFSSSDYLINGDSSGWKKDTLVKQEEPEVSCSNIKEKVDKTRKVCKSLCLTKKKTVVNTDKTSSSTNRSDRITTIFNSKEDMPPDQYQQSQVKKQQQRTHPVQKECQEKLSPSKYVSTQISEFDNAVISKNKMKEQYFNQLKEVADSNISSVAVVTSSSSSTSRSIFRSSQPRRSLQETISTFTTSQRARHIMGAPSSKKCGQNSCAVTKVTPQDRCSSRVKLQQPKERYLSSTPEHNRPQACKQSKENKTSNSIQHDKQQDKMRSPLFPPNITKLIGYSIGNASTSCTSSTIPKGILKGIMIFLFYFFL